MSERRELSMVTTVANHIASELQRAGRMPPGTDQRRVVLLDLDDFVKRALPSGSGINNGISLNSYEGDPSKGFELYVPYHHMDDNGMYCGWQDYIAKVRADLTERDGFSVSVRAPKRTADVDRSTLSDTADYLRECIEHELHRMCGYDSTIDLWVTIPDRHVPVSASPTIPGESK